MNTFYIHPDLASKSGGRTPRIRDGLEEKEKQYITGRKDMSQLDTLAIYF